MDRRTLENVAAWHYISADRLPSQAPDKERHLAIADAIMWGLHLYDKREKDRASST